jgi:predicted RNA-binding Zn-ribbon protein involved in translation (DUF1610 family)
MEKCIRYEVDEVDRISFECPVCGTEIVYRVKDTGEVPASCPCTPKEQSMAMESIFSRYRGFILAVKKDGAAVRLIAKGDSQS